MRVGLIGFAALCVGLAGCDPNQQQAKKDIEAATDAASAQLIDPNSAQFRDVVVRRTEYQGTGLGHFYAVCGEINGKNSFGGYVGFRKFAVKVRDEDTDGKLTPVEKLEPEMGYGTADGAIATGNEIERRLCKGDVWPAGSKPVSKGLDG